MKLLFFIHSLSSGGAERVTVTLANYWAQKGWAVTIVTVAGMERDFYSLEPEVKRVALNIAALTRNPGQAFLQNGRRIWGLRRILHQEEPDVAVAMMATANATLALAGRLAKVPAFGSERTFPPALPLGGFWELVRRWSYPLLSGLVAQTEESAAWLREHAPARRIAVIPNPVQYPLPSHSPKLLPSDFPALSRGQYLLVAVGRLGEEKRFDLLLTVFAALVDRHPDWSLVILGQGEQRQTLLDQVAELGIGDRVALPGAVGNVGDWFEAADLYALTSRFEGFPNTLLEALAHGLPVVAVDCQTGPKEIVRHEVDGLLVPQNDQAALKAALERLMSDRALRAQFAERAVETRERYSVARIAAQWEQIFADV